MKSTNFFLKRMLRRVSLWAVGWLGVVVCKLQQGNNVYPLSNNLEVNNRMYPTSSNSVSVPCRNFPVCLLVDKANGALKNSFTGYSINQERSLQGRSYYNGYGTPAPPTYYPTFDPISVLASLAFLAFLLQSFTSLYDRSRSIIPSILSSRQASPEFTISGIAKRVLRALDEYEDLNDDLLATEQNNVELS